MSRLEKLTEDEKARYDALTFRMCEEDHWDVSRCDCPGDCEDVQETEAEVQAVIEKIWREECVMEIEPTEWTVRESKPLPPPDLILTSPRRCVTVRCDGYVFIHSTLEHDRRDSLIFKTGNLRPMIASLQSILVLAEEHFGEEWGK